MEWNQVFDYILKTAPIAAAIVTAMATLAVGMLALLNARFSTSRYAQQNQAIDLAKNRLEYWEKFLKSSKTVHGTVSPEYDQSKISAHDAITTIHAELNTELTRLSYERQIDLAVGKKAHQLLGASGKWVWTKIIFCRLMAGLFAVLTALLYGSSVVMEMKNVGAPTPLKVLVTMICSSILTGLIYRHAYRIKFPKPQRPVVDRV